MLAKLCEGKNVKESLDILNYWLAFNKTEVRSAGRVVAQFAIKEDKTIIREDALKECHPELIRDLLDRYNLEWSNIFKSLFADVGESVELEVLEKCKKNPMLKNAAKELCGTRLFHFYYMETTTNITGRLLKLLKPHFDFMYTPYPLRCFVVDLWSCYWRHHFAKEKIETLVREIGDKYDDRNVDKYLCHLLCVEHGLESSFEAELNKRLGVI